MKWLLKQVKREPPARRHLRAGSVPRHSCLRLFCLTEFGRNNSAAVATLASMVDCNVVSLHNGGPIARFELWPQAKHL